MGSSGSKGSEIGFFPFFLAPVPLALPFPLLFPVSEGLPLAVLPMNLNGLMGGAISDTCLEGIRSGASLVVLVVAGCATKRTVGSIRTSWDLGMVGPSRNDPI